MALDDWLGFLSIFTHTLRLLNNFSQAKIQSELKYGVPLLF